MRQLFITSFLFLSVLLPGTQAAAQTPLANREPGLWELRLVGGTGLASIALGVQQMFKSLPESQRKQMEHMLGRKGPELPTVIRQCLTPEMARADLKTHLRSQGVECSQLDWQESGGNGQFSFACTNPDGNWTGEGRIWDATARSFNSAAKVQGHYQGQPVTLDMQHEARWLGADCKGVSTAQ